MKAKWWIGATAVVAVFLFLNWKRGDHRDGGGDHVKKLEVAEVQEGKGALVAGIGNQVSIHYTAWKWDGMMFDNTYDRQKPLVFRIGQGQVYRGLEQGVIGMKVGGKRKLTIPPDMAAGINGTGGAIPRNAAFIYEVELLKIEH